MGKLVDLTDKRYGRLVCLERMEERRHGHVVWKFQCDCGNVIEARGVDVRNGKTTSCGCYRNERTKKANIGIAPKDRKKLR